MPIIKMKLKGKRFKVQKPEEKEIIERAVEGYRNSGHDIHDFLVDFFGVHSFKPSIYLGNIKGGSNSISIKAWNKLNNYVSTLQTK